MSDQTGLVIASYGQRGILRQADRQTSRYVLKGRKLRAVCGDHVLWSPATHGDEVIVEQILERRNVLARPNSRGAAEVLASNLDQLIVVTAPEPEPDLYIVDRFICAAELMAIKSVIVWNKSDLLPAPHEDFKDYVALGYSLVTVSADAGSGMEKLNPHLAQGVSMLVGQSGVGKSSLLNRLVPDADARVSELSTATGEGRHTTTASLMLELRQGGSLIDSPGVRDFAPAIDARARIQSGFREIVALADQCRFSDCSHLREPACAVKAAVALKTISERRYESYKRLHNLTE